MDTVNNSETEAVLREWRTKILNVFLVIVAVAATPAWAMVIINVLQEPARWMIVGVFLTMTYALLVVLAVFRGIASRVRVWGLLLVGYSAAVANLGMTGQKGVGSWYLFALPVIGFVIMGVRSGILSSIISAVLAVIFVILFEQGALAPVDASSVNPWASFSAFVMLLVTDTTLLVLFYRFQGRLIANERRAQALLEAQNATLEQKVQEHTGELQERINELQIINSIQQGLAAELDFRAAVNMVGDKLREVFRTLDLMIGWHDPQANLLHYLYLCEHGQRITVPAIPPLPGGKFETMQKTRQPIVFNTPADYETVNASPIPGTDQGKSLVSVPIISGDRVLGLVQLENYERENAYGEAEVRLLTTIAGSLGSALENARLFNETQRLLKETEQRAAELQIINSIQHGLASKLDLQSIVDLVGDKLREILNINDLGIRLYDKQTDRMVYLYVFEQGERVDVPPIEPTPMFRKMLDDRQPYFGSIAELVRKYHLNLAPEEIEHKALATVPIISGNQVVGGISGENFEDEEYFNESNIRLMQTIAASMGVALENARLFDETQRLLRETEQRAVELATINTVSRELAGELDLEPLINLVGEQMRTVFKADIAYVALLDEASNTINFPYTYGEELTSIQANSGLTGKIIQTGEPLLINQEMDRQAEELGTTIIGKQARSYLGVPILVSGKPAGVISVQSTEREGVFNLNDQSLLNTLAANVGTALHNARLFTESQNQKKFSEALIDFLPDATLVIDREGHVLAWNRAIEEMTGVKAENMLGKSNYAYALPFYGECRPILIDLVLMPHDEFEAKYAHLQRAGNLLLGETYTPNLRGGRYLHATASAFHDSKGNIVGAIETIRDITERKNAEVELQKAKEAADAANASKSAFLANMSHELRTPLNAIIGFTRIVRRKTESLIPEKQTENLDKVLTSAEHLLNLINTVLDIAKIEAGRMDVLAANFRVAPLIDLCVNTAQPLIRPGVMLEKQVDETLATVYSDQDKIRQIVLNLLSNAAKFTHTGKILLTASRDGDHLRLAVSDTGIGISAEALPRIFKEFQQADNTTTRQYGGTGLGLSISRNLAQLLGGDLTVESEPGKGSTFALVIPLQYGSKSAPANAAPAPVQSTVPPSEPGSAKKRILVIDDDPDAVYLLQENLNPQEYEIIGTRNGSDGLRLASEQRPQAVLLDIIMPGADGWQVLHDLKENPDTANIPVILLTIVDKKALGFRLGAAAYLLKPLDPAAVREALRRVILPDGRPQKHLLVVDDDPNVADMLRQFLPEAEFKLDSAPDGVAGLEAIAASRPDILLLDIMMPRLDGFGVIENLRANPQTRDLPIIVISAKDLTEAEAARLKETVAVVMKKQGFQGEKLMQEINSVLTA